MAIIISSGEIESGIILENDAMTILDGGVATTTTVNASGEIRISSGGTAESTTINNGGRVYVSSGGTAESTTIREGGVLHVSSGGLANSTGINDGGRLDVSSGGTADGTIVSKWGMMNVFLDGLADGTAIASDGRLYVSSGGSAVGTTVGSAGYLYVSRGGSAIGVSVGSGSILYVSSGATLTDLAAVSGASLNFYVAPGTYIAGTYEGSAFVIENGAVSDYAVNGNCRLYISSGCTADSVAVSSGGELRIRSGGSADGVTVKAGGEFYVQNGGTATGIAWTPCEGHVYVYDGGNATFVSEYSGVYYGSGNKLLSSALVMEGGALDAGFEMYVMSGGTAIGAAVNEGGRFYISGSGVADHAEVNEGGSMNVCSGGTATGVTVNDGGKFYISSGGFADSATVNDGGRLYISGGGTADHATVNEGGEFIISSGTADHIAVNEGGSFDIGSGGIAADVTVNLMGYVHISDGGTATDILENGGYVEVNDGAAAAFLSNTLSGLELEDGRYATLHSNTMATGTVVNYDGGLYILGGQADHTAVNDGGELVVSDGRADSTTVNSGGSASIERTGTASCITVNDGGNVFVSRGGEASDVAVSAGGKMKIGSEGSVTGAGVNSGGSAFVGSGGTAADIEVDDGGKLEIGSGGTILTASVRSGGVITGYVDCEDVTFDPGAVLQFDISVIAPGNESALVNLAGIAEAQDCPSFSLPVPDSQEYGDYKLAEGAQGFGQKTISVFNSVMDFGPLSLDRSVAVGGREYTLNLNDGGELVLSVNAAEPARYVYLDFDGEELVRYSNPELELSFDLSVADPAFSEERRAAVVSALSEQYGKYNIVFTADRPEGSDYSTLYFGASSAFDEYGDFFGISETYDGNDRIRDDNAFVLLDSGYSDEQIISVASNMLDHLMGFSFSGSADGSPAILRYAESKALLSLSAGWNQKDPYNKYCPVDPNTGERCVVGCTNTAASQIIYYWLEKGLLDFTLTLTDADAYRSNADIMIESSDDPASGHLPFAETNDLLQSFDILSEDSIAALCFAAGVVQQADYSSDETGTAWRKKLFVRAGFEKDEEAKEFEYGASDYDIMIYELLHGRPVGISLLKQEHAIVADGYDSARNMFHLDLGWGNDSNRWYTMEEMDALRVYVEISGYTPVVSPDLTVGDLSAGADVVYLNEDVTLSFSVSNEGKEVSEETLAYVYYGDTVLGACGVNYISSGCSRGFTCTVSTAPLQIGENVLTVKVSSQNGEGTVSEASVTIECRNGDVVPLTQTWEEIPGASQYIAEYSTDGFGHGIRLAAETNSLDSFQLPEGTCQMRVKPAEGEQEWIVLEPVAAGAVSDEPKLVRSNADGNTDVFFVNAGGTWGTGYAARHVGSTGGTWEGTNELAAIFGRNRLEDIIEGSADANVLLMTDDDNGDALFVDDIYSASPGELGLSRSRIARIGEIRAGAGDDIVDMTSQRFEYTGDGLTVRGGDGDDIIWANKGDNLLFGDAGDDRIVGASGRDVIAGGIGNDRMHGGGGDDIFTFCGDWGNDEVEQLAGGTVTLWFTPECEDTVVWDEASRSCTDGENSITVRGDAPVTLKFGGNGDDAAMYAALSEAGAFEEVTSHRIFEESKGLLA